MTDNEHEEHLGQEPARNDNDLEAAGSGDGREEKPAPLTGWRVARIAGIDIFINYSWLIIFGLVTWSLAEGFFPAMLPRRPPALYWGLGVAAGLLLFCSVLVHEVTHSLVARHLGLPISGITLFLFGGVSNLSESPHTPGAELKIALSGPLSSFALSGLFFTLDAVFAPGPPAVLALLFYLWVVNLLLGVFNIVPGFPLDGGRVLRALLWWKTGNLQRSTLMAAASGGVVGWALVVAGVLRVFFYDNPLGGFWLVVMGLFLRNAAAWSAERARQGQEV